MIAKGADIEAKDCDGLTALHLANCFGHPTIAEQLRRAQMRPPIAPIRGALKGQQNG